MNKVILLGHLTRDVELRYGQSGVAIGKTAIATSRKAKNSQTGKYDKDEVMFVDLTIFGRTAEVVQQYFKKGSKILIDGRLSFDQWTDQSGMKRSKHNVIVENIEFPESKSSQNSGGGNYGNNQNQNQQQQNGGNNNNYGNSNGNYPQQQQNGGGNNYGSQNNNYNQPAPQNSVPPVENPQQISQPKAETVPEIDINDMDDQVPF